jgi:ureidoglycolate hydrolase
MAMINILGLSRLAKPVQARITGHDIALIERRWEEKRMVWGRVATVTALLAMGFAGSSIGQDVQFQTTEEEMIQELTRQPMPTRSFVPEGQKRRIVVVKRERAQTVETTVPVDEASSGPQVRLKIEFDHDSYAVRAESFPLLDELGRALISDQL